MSAKHNYKQTSLVTPRWIFLRADIQTNSFRVEHDVDGVIIYWLCKQARLLRVARISMPTNHRCSPRGACKIRFNVNWIIQIWLGGFPKISHQLISNDRRASVRKFTTACLFFCVRLSNMWQYSWECKHVIKMCHFKNKHYFKLINIYWYRILKTSILLKSNIIWRCVKQDHWWLI